ncbi:MAG: SDR family oxidoreductase, partial [Lachnospiraceae bacterium]|nr:SDR family oxidoreductase [Lachnospiraceae bacterium]
IAAGLLKKGCKVAGVDKFDDSAEVLESLFENEGFTYFQYDLNDLEGMAALVEKINAAMGGIDGMVNSAAYSTRGPIDDVSYEDYDDYMLLNQKSLFFLVKTALPYIRAEGKGSIVNMSSLRSVQSDGRHVLYSMVKGAIVSFTRELAVCLAPDHIRVNCISPAYVLTPMTRHNLSREGWLEKQLESSLIGRLVEQEDVAAMAEFLISDESAGVTGQDLFVDGGTTIKRA